MSPPEPPSHMPVSISLWKVSHIFGHFSEMNSKSPKPSNSSHSIPSLAFLSADFTKESKTILDARVRVHKDSISYIYKLSYFGKVSNTGIRRCVRDETTLCGSPRFSNLPHKMMLRMMMVMILMVMVMIMVVVTTMMIGALPADQTFPQAASHPPPCLGQPQKNAKAGPTALGTLPDSLAYHRPCVSTRFSGNSCSGRKDVQNSKVKLWAWLKPKLTCPPRF